MSIEFDDQHEPDYQNPGLIYNLELALGGREEAFFQTEYAVIGVFVHSEGYQIAVAWLDRWRTEYIGVAVPLSVESHFEVDFSGQIVQSEDRHLNPDRSYEPLSPSTSDLNGLARTLSSAILLDHNSD